MSRPKIPFTDEQVYEAAVRLGSMPAAARELGISGMTAWRCARRHAALTGGEIPRAPRGPAREVPSPFDRLEAQLEEVAATVAHLTSLVETLLTQPSAPRLVEFRPEHRRMVDGGRRVREQRRDARRAIA